jgi:phage gpG-like protein
MIRATFSVNGIKELSERLRNKLAELKNKATPLSQASIIMYQAVMRNFREESDGKAPWKDLSPLTIALRRNKNKSSIKKLQDTGRLRMSIFPDIGENYASVGTNVTYARTQHAGGKTTTPRIVIAPKRGKVLSFMIGGRRVFAKYVIQPPRQVTIPARPFMVMRGEDESRIIRLFTKWAYGNL